MKILLPCLMLLVAGVTMAGAAAPEQKKSVALSWVFQIKNEGEHPKGKVFLKVGQTQHLVVPQARANYQKLEASDFKDYHVPKNAVLAAMSWYAGYGDILYVLRKGNSLEVYQQEMDEAEDSKYPVKRILVIPLQS